MSHKKTQNVHSVQYPQLTGLKIPTEVSSCISHVTFTAVITMQTIFTMHKYILIKPLLLNYYMKLTNTEAYKVQTFPCVEEIDH